MPRFNFKQGLSQSGFTAVELMVTVAVLAIIVGIGLPSMLTFIERARVDAAADDLAQAMRYARSEAITRNISVNVVNAGNNYADGWSVVANGTALRVHEGLPAGVATNYGNDITFFGRGMASASGTIRVTYEGHARCISFTLSGAVTQSDC